MQSVMFATCFCCRRELEADEGAFLPSKNQIGKFFFVCDDCDKKYPTLKKQFSAPLRFGTPERDNVTTWDEELNHEISMLSGFCESFLNQSKAAKITPELLKNTCRLLYLCVNDLGEKLPG